MRPGLISLLLFAALGFLAGCSNKADNGVPPAASLFQSTVLIAKNGGQGSGTIIGPGLVLTAYHVVRGKGQPNVRFLAGPSHTGKVIWSEPDRDLALVEVDIPKGYPIAPIECDELAPGQQVVTIGHPLRSKWVAFHGPLPRAEARHKHFVSLGFTIGRGVSGGPVFNNQGQVVGISLAILARHPSAQTGIGFMLPASVFCQTIREQQAS